MAYKGCFLGSKSKDLLLSKIYVEKDGEWVGCEVVGKGSGFTYKRGSLDGKDVFVSLNEVVQMGMLDLYLLLTSAEFNGACDSRIGSVSVTYDECLRPVGLEFSVSGLSLKDSPDMLKEVFNPSEFSEDEVRYFESQKAEYGRLSCVCSVRHCRKGCKGLSWVWFK